MLSQAVFLVGGLGTRLKEQTRATPKPLLDVGGRPFLEYLLDEAARQCFTEILLLAGHLGDQVRTMYDGRTWRGAQIRVLCESKPLGTGGALRFALSHLKPQFLLANGDSFFDINLRALSAGLPKAGAAMALRNVSGDRYGRVKLDGHKVLSFHAPQDGVSGPINGGIYALDRDVVETIPEGKISLEGDIFPALAARGAIEGREFDSYFIDIGVPADLERAQSELPRRVCRPAVFFDRDGVLNRDVGYLYQAKNFEWLEGAKSALRLCNNAGYFVFVVTNQAGIARGYYNESDVEKLHAWMLAELAPDGAYIDGFEYCPHHLEGVRPDYRRACPRRKPQPGMILDILAKWPVDKGASFLIGNTQSDLDAAAAAGIPSLLYQSGDVAALVAPHLSKKNSS